MHKIFLIIISVWFLSGSCSSGVTQRDVEPIPKLPPTVNYKNVKIKTPMRTFLGTLSGLYSCMIKKTYTYMYCDSKNEECSLRKQWRYDGKKTGVKLIDNLGVFGAGTSGFFYYGNMGECLMKQIGKKSKGSFWDLSPLEKVSGIKYSLGKILGSVPIYNKKIVKWAMVNLIPPPDKAFMGTTYRNIYHSMLFRTARLYALVYISLFPKIEEEALKYKKYIESTKNSDGIKYLKDRYSVATSKIYPLTDNGTFLTGFHVTGFWLRRHLDGTERALCLALGRLLTLYDPQFVSKNSKKMHLFK